MGFQHRMFPIFGRLFLAWFFVLMLGFLLFTLLVSPFVRWLVLDASWEYSFGWREFSRVLLYSAGLAMPISLVMWIEGRMSGRW